MDEARFVLNTFSRRGPLKCFKFLGGNEVVVKEVSQLRIAIRWAKGLQR